MIRLTTKGLFCEAGDFHIDPSRRVETALITHAHSDHARAGSARYYCAEPGAGLLALRIGATARITAVPYGEIIRFGRSGEVEVSFHPAGHILGSAQIRVRQGDEVWVASGDYKREPDPTCRPFEVLKCDTFITEATFGNPAFHWRDTESVPRAIHDWWQENSRRGVNSLLYCYALGKTQRVLAELGRFTGREVLVFGEAHPITECYRQQGVQMVPTRRLEDLPLGRKLEGELIVAPHSINRSPWMERLGPMQTAFASGWMGRGKSRWHGRQGYQKGFVLSDHSDWPALLQTIQETGAKRVFVQHASDGSLVKHLRKLGLFAEPMDRSTLANSLKDEKAGLSTGYGPVQGELFANWPRTVG